MYGAKRNEDTSSIVREQPFHVLVILAFYVQTSSKQVGRHFGMLFFFFFPSKLRSHPPLKLLRMHFDDRIGYFMSLLRCKKTKK